MRCPQCAREAQIHDGFCSGCGTALEAAVGPLHDSKDPLEGDISPASEIDQAEGKAVAQRAEPVALSADLNRAHPKERAGPSGARLLVWLFLVASFLGICWFLHARRERQQARETLEAQTFLDRNTPDRSASDSIASVLEAAREDIQDLKRLLDAMGPVNLEPTSLTFGELKKRLQSEPDGGIERHTNTFTGSWLHGAVKAEFFYKDNGPGEIYSIELASEFPASYRGAGLPDNIALCGFRAGSPPPQAATRVQSLFSDGARVEYFELSWKGPWRLWFDVRNGKTLSIKVSDSRYMEFPVKRSP
jgi:hypothetical protein